MARSQPVVWSNQFVLRCDLCRRTRTRARNFWHWRIVFVSTAALFVSRDAGKSRDSLHVGMLSSRDCAGLRAVSPRCINFHFLHIICESSYLNVSIEL